MSSCMRMRWSVSLIANPVPMSQHQSQQPKRYETLIILMQIPHGTYSRQPLAVVRQCIKSTANGRAANNPFPQMP